MRTTSRRRRRHAALGAAAWLLAAPLLARADEPIAAPRPLAPLHAEYPAGASGEADVTLELTVDAAGAVEAARVMEGAAAFGAAAVAASRGFRFAPATRGDRPLRARIRARIHFIPPAPEAPAPPPPPPAPAPPGPLAVVVLGEPRAPGGTSLGQAEVRVLPGAFGDPFRAVEALPGVTPIFSGLPYFYVRGAPPGNVGYLLDGIRVPALYHVLAGPAVVPPALMERVELFPGAYPAQYGRFAGGVVAGETRPPATELRAEATLRLVDAGALVEVPLPGGRGAALAGGRYSYTAPALALFTPDLRLSYWDYQARLALNLTPHDRLTVFAFGSRDDSSQRQNGVWHPLFAAEFHRVQVRYDADLGPRTRVSHSLTFGLDRSNGAVTNDPVAVGMPIRTAVPVLRDTSVAARTLVLHRLSDAVLIRAGADATLDAYGFDADSLPAAAGVLFGPRLDLAVGLHADAVIAAGRGVEITPGLRVDLWGSRGSSTVSVDPRLAVKVPLGARLRLIDTAGLAHQTPGFGLPVPGVALAGLAGGLQRTFQESLGMEADLPLAFTASATVFYDAFFNLSDPFGVGGADPALVHANTIPALLGLRQLGSALGLEVYLRRRLSERLGGFLAYTLSRSTRAAGRATFAAQFDRTHVLQGALSWNIGRGFRVGARAAFYTGTPLQPFNPSAVVAFVGRDRLPPFFRLDTRAEKRWEVGQRGFISLVLEMLNTTLSREPNGVTCVSYSPLQCEVSRLGPVSIPSIGIEAGI
jgi:TonB family protein